MGEQRLHHQRDDDDQPVTRRQPRSNPPHITLIGLMGAGKTTTANLLATRLGIPQRDSDRDIETLTGRTGRAIADLDGVGILHRLEEAVLLGALVEDAPHVITAAGSTIDSTLCRDALRRRATVILLELPLDVLADRIATGAHRRTMSPDELRTLSMRRTPHMRTAADMIADATKPTDEIVTRIIEFCRPPQTGPG